MSPAPSQIVDQLSSHFHSPEQFATVQRAAGGLLATSPLVLPAIAAPFRFRDPEED